MSSDIVMVSNAEQSARSSSVLHPQASAFCSSVNPISKIPTVATPARDWTRSRGAVESRYLQASGGRH